MLTIEKLKVNDPSGGKILDITLKISSGGIYALTGEGACGKSTLLRTLSATLPSDFSYSYKSIDSPIKVYYLPQEEHKYVRFKSGLERNESCFLNSIKSLPDDEQALILIDELVLNDKWSVQLKEIATNNKNHIILIATHNQELMAKFAHEIILMRDGDVYIQSDSKSFFENRGKDKYVENLLKFGF